MALILRSMASAWLLLPLLVTSVWGLSQDPDYFLDDSLLNNLDKGEVERLLREYPINRELVNSIGAQYYQIVNVVQHRHHQYMDLSTREGTTKGPRSQAQGMQAMQQFRAGKHFHRTSFLIQAFNHKFKLILELNPTLIAPNVLQKHILSENAEQRERNELEMCYYHGNVEGLEWSAAAVRTCNGLSGIIHMGNETFIIHPFYGGDLSQKHPHIVFEAKAVGRQTCGNKRGFEWNMPSGTVYSDFVRRTEDKSPQYFIELALLLDKPMFDKRNGSTRLQVVHDALQIVNIADLYFRKLNTAISVVYVETWNRDNHLQVAKVDDLRLTLVRLTDFYGPRSIFSVTKDTTMLISGVPFSESGMGVPSSICTQKAMGVVTDVSIYQPHNTGVALAHMIGHNLNMGHDQNMENCHCPNWYGCIMSENIVGKDGIQPYRFSDCSRKSFFSSISSGHSMCLINKPNAIDTLHKTCGNGVLEAGEECDCGSQQECQKDPCCEAMICRLKTTAQCSSNSPCCNEKCQFKSLGVICRDKASECDIPEHCTGVSAECPMNIYKKNGASCGRDEGFCFNGNCPTLNSQCKNIWDFGGKVANKECFEHFNTGGHHNGHCGKDKNGNYRKCPMADVMCGTLHCKDGTEYPIMSSTFQNTTFSKISLKLGGINHDCKNINGPRADRNSDMMELVRDGSRCGDNMVCMNQTCVRLANYIDNQKCPSNHFDLECSGHGSCSNVNTCYCKEGWEGDDCSIIGIVPTTEEAHTVPPPGHVVLNETTTVPPGKIRNKGPDEEGSNTIVLVFGMVSVVGGVFILFAMLALCYRRSTVPKYETSYPPFNPKTFKLPTHGPGGPVNQINHSEIDNRILSFTQLPAYRYSRDSDGSYREQQSMGMTGSMKNIGGGGQHDEETGDETSAFLGEARLSDAYQEDAYFGSEFPLIRNSNERIPNGGQDEDSNDDGGPIRIRNLEDLLRQLEHHSGGRQMSPEGSEEIRMSETEADRHYRLHSDDLGGNLGFDSDSETGFVMGRYRGPGVEPINNITSPLSDYGHFTAGAADTPDDDLESNQTNLITSSTSEEDEEEQMSMGKRNLKPLYEPRKDSFSNESPLHINGSDLFEEHLHFPEYKH